MEGDADSFKKEVFNIFVKSSIPGARWGGGCVVFVVGPGGQPQVERSYKLWKEHPETAMLRKLKEVLPTYGGSTMEVRVFQNASPCSRCSQEYIQLINKAMQLNVSLRLEVAFVALYKVCRPSRKAQPSYSVISLHPEVHRLNVRSLQNLNELGVQLRIFGQQDWQNLRELLCLPPYLQEEEVKVDRNLYNDLQELLGEDVQSYAGEEEEEEDAESEIYDGGYQHFEDHEEGSPFLMFWENGLHGVRWARGARAVYVIDGQEASEVFKNTETGGDYHAEAHLLRHLKQHLLRVPGPDIKVTIYQNLSPCGSCCEKYDTFLTNYSCNDADGASRKNIDLTIIFSRFYQIKRPSCAECNLHPTPSDNDHYRAVGGLLRLRDKGVAMHCFQEQDWVALHQHLQVPEELPVYTSSRRKMEDELMADDAKKIFHFDMVARAGEGERGALQVTTQELQTLQNTLLAALEDRFQRIEAELNALKIQAENNA